MKSMVFKKYLELSQSELYKILQLRCEVFVVEQNCAYQDLDFLDQIATHAWIEIDQKIVSYLRILPEKSRFHESSLGRLVTKKEYRQNGYAKDLIQEALKMMKKDWGILKVRISAQKYLEKYYQSLGFQTDSEEYLEDGIPHVEMVINLKKAKA